MYQTLDNLMIHSSCQPSSAPNQDNNPRPRLRPLISVLVIDSSLFYISCLCVVHPRVSEAALVEISDNLCPAFVNDTDSGRMAAARLCSIQIVKYNGNGESRGNK